MSDGGNVDENLFNASKQREQAGGRIESPLPFDRLSGVMPDDASQSAANHLERTVRLSEEYADLEDTGIGHDLARFHASREATRAVNDGDGTKLANLSGVTEQDLDASNLTLPARLQAHLENGGATAFVVGAGNPNTGKTNTASLLAELWKTRNDDGLVLSNVRSWSMTDVVTTSMHDLMVETLRHRAKPKLVFVDEGSTHFDARTKRREVATQWTPAAKRFAKVGVDVAVVVIHTGKDLHPELKRLATLPFWKSAKDQVEFYETWPADDDEPDDRLFGGGLEELEATSKPYDPDDAAPWNWNLEADLFARDLDWPDLLDELEQRGPDE